MEVLFVISTLVALVGTFLLITQKHAVYALIGLLVAFAATAGIFVALDSAFIAVSQIIIYAGALAVMFLFVLMFTDTRTGGDTNLPGAVGSRAVYDPGSVKPARKKIRPEIETLLGIASGFQTPKPMAVFVALAMLACFTVTIFALPESFNSFGDLPGGYDGVTFSAVQPDEDGNVAKGVLEYGDTDTISRTIFEGFPLAFEVVSLLIFAALLGAVLLARRHLAGAPGTQDVGKEQTHA